MSWGLGWKRPSETFHVTLNYGTEDAFVDYSPASSVATSSSSSSSSSGSNRSSSCAAQDQTELGFRIDLEWTAGDDEDQTALRLQSQLMVALPLPQDSVQLRLGVDDVDNVAVHLKVIKRRDPLRAVVMSKAGGSGQQSDGVGVLARLIKAGSGEGSVGEKVAGCCDHWMSVTVVSLCSCGLSALPVELTRLPLLEKLYLDNNKLSLLPSELGDLKKLKVLRVDYNMLVSVPVELRQCDGLVELSLEHNKLVHPLLDFRLWQSCKFSDYLATPLSFYLKFCHYKNFVTCRLQISELLRMKMWRAILTLVHQGTN